MNNYVSPWMDEDLSIFRDAAVRFLETEMVPNDENVRVPAAMNEYLVCRMFADARVQRIYGGTNEIMKELISRAL